MSPVIPRRRRALQGLAALAAAPAASSWAAVGGLPAAEHRDSSPEWERLSGKLFAGKSLIHGQSVVQLFVPLRAAYGALELRDACECLLIRAVGSGRLGRPGVDVWLTLEVLTDRSDARPR